MTEADNHRELIESLTGARVGGRYVVERLLGKGGMGFVVSARYPELDQHVAVKFMWPEFASSPILASRFLREARVAANVQSQHLVKVFDVGRLDSGIPYLVMERLHGRDLADELDARGPLPLIDAVDYLLQSMEGIAEVHALGMVHRDLKPSNLFLARSPSGTTVKVLDFGISKDVAPKSVTLTSTETVLGTPSYMSPEQVKSSKEVDARSDIWSLGIIFHELLAKRLPFSGASVGEMFGAILHTEPEPIEAHRDDLPFEVSAIIAKCLQRRPEARYADLGELAEAMRAVARTTEAHRISAIQNTLALGESKRAISIPPERAHDDRATAPTAEQRREEKATALATPREHPSKTPSPDSARTAASPVFEMGSSAPAPALPRPIAPPPVTSSSWSGDTGSRRRSRALVLAFLVGVPVAIVATMLGLHARSSGAVVSSSSPPTAETQAASATVTAATNAPAVTPAPSAIEPAPTNQGVETISPKPVPSTRPIATAKHAAPPSTATATATPSAAPKADSLVLDRK